MVFVGSGFESLRVNKGRTYIEFSGNAARVQQALKIQLHRYLVDGTEQMANDRDPQVPYALSPVVRGIVGLNDFPIHSPMHAGRYVERNLSTGTYTVLKPSVPPMDGASPAAQAPVQPDFTFDYGSLVFEFVSPYDFATIYNSLPLWNAGTPIVGTGVTIAIVGDGNINPNDIATFRKSFGLPARVPKVIYTSKNPGGATSSENTLDIEMAGAAAPGANITLVVPPNGTTVGGLLTAISYIVDNETAPIMSASYGVCELKLGTSGNALVNSAWQQGATEGISIFVSAGDQGSAGCTGQGTPDSADTYGLQVNGFASSPFVTAVGGTDFVWGWRSGGENTYWNKTANTATGASAKGYIPEIPWNTTCADPVIADYYFLTSAGKPEFASPEAVCNAISSAKNRYSPLLTIGAGSGGVSDCTIPSGTTTATCAGGYAKPSWQTGIGVPADGKRDVPDVALFASYGWPDFAAFGSLTPIVPESSEILFCYSGGTNPHACSYSSYGTIVYQGNGGTLGGIAVLVGHHGDGAAEAWRRETRARKSDPVQAGRQGNAVILQYCDGEERQHLHVLRHRLGHQCPTLQERRSELRDQNRRRRIRDPERLQRHDGLRYDHGSGLGEHREPGRQLGHHRALAIRVRIDRELELCRDGGRLGKRCADHHRQEHRRRRNRAHERRNHADRHGRRLVQQDDDVRSLAGRGRELRHQHYLQADGGRLPGGHTLDRGQRGQFAAACRLVLQHGRGDADGLTGKPHLRSDGARQDQPRAERDREEHR